jgi:MFS family permease
MQGFGAGGTLNLVSVVISDITSLRERAAYTSLAALAWAIGTNIGVWHSAGITALSHLICI